MFSVQAALGAQGQPKRVTGGQVRLMDILGVLIMLVVHLQAHFPGVAIH